MRFCSKSAKSQGGYQVSRSGTCDIQEVYALGDVYLYPWVCQGYSYIYIYLGDIRLWDIFYSLVWLIVCFRSSGLWLPKNALGLHCPHILSWRIPCFFSICSHDLWCFLDIYVECLIYRIFSHHLSIFIMCFKITFDLFCTNPTTPSSVEAPRPISRYFPRVSEKLVLAAAAEELERAPPRQVPGKRSLKFLPQKNLIRDAAGSSGGKNRSILVLTFFSKKSFQMLPRNHWGIAMSRHHCSLREPWGTSLNIFHNHPWFRQ